MMEESPTGFELPDACARAEIAAALSSSLSHIDFNPEGNKEPMQPDFEEDLDAMQPERLAAIQVVNEAPFCDITEEEKEMTQEASSVSRLN